MSWTIAILIGVTSALIIGGLGGATKILNVKSTGFWASDEFVCYVVAIAASGLYIASEADRDTLVRLVVGAGVGSGLTIGLRWLRRHL